MMKMDGMQYFCDAHLLVLDLKYLISVLYKTGFTVLLSVAWT